MIATCMSIKMPSKAIWALLLLFQCIECQEKDSLWPQCEETEACFTQGHLCLDCSLVDCQPSFEPRDCPEGTTFTPNLIMGCCPACAKHLKLGDKCILSNATLLATTEELPCTNYRALKSDRLSVTANGLPTLTLFSCGDGYKCDEVTETCDAKEEFACSNAEKEYQSWFETQGETNTCEYYDWVRQCNPKGQYGKIQAKISPFTEQKDARRFCTDPTGNRIFGDAPIDPEAEADFDINCKCSRKVWELKQTIHADDGQLLLQGRRDVTLHCQKYGNFEELQCDEGRCWCVDPETAKVASVVVHQDLAKFLRCYNEATFGSQYLRRCESRTYGRAITNKILANHGLVWSQTEDYTCDLDGSFAPVNCKQDQIKCGCVDKYNRWLKSYNDANNLKSEFNCLCARDEASNPQLGLYCDKRGNYAPIQQFVSPAPGKEFCVDGDGFQNTPKYQINGGPNGKKCKITNCEARFKECHDINADGSFADNGQCETCDSSCY